MYRPGVARTSTSSVLTSLSGTSAATTAPIRKAVSGSTSSSRYVPQPTRPAVTSTANVANRSPARPRAGCRTAAGLPYEHVEVAMVGAGWAGDVILEAVAEHPGTVVCTATHSRDRFSRLVEGSVTGHVRRLPPRRRTAWRPAPR